MNNETNRIGAFIQVTQQEYFGLRSGLSQCNHLANNLNAFSGQQYGGLMNATPSPKVRKLHAAQTIAAEVRARRLEMQVKKLKQPQE